MPKFIDIHCHLAEYKELDLAELAVHKEIIFVSTALNRDEIAFHLKRGIKYWFAGIHPWDAKFTDLEVSEICKLIPYDKIIGLGEIGLDKYYPNPDRQLVLLENQLRKAKELQLPTLYHLVGKEYDFLKLQKKIKLDRMKIIHGFNSSYEVFKELDKLGFYFSLSKRIINNPKQESVVRAILETKRFFLESDAPNNSGLDEVKIIAKCLEIDYHIVSDKLKEILVSNFNNLLKENFELNSKK